MGQDTTNTYARLARRADRAYRYNETPEGSTGAVERELLHTNGRIRGLVAGACGEMSSDDLERLIKYMYAEVCDAGGCKALAPNGGAKPKRSQGKIRCSSSPRPGGRK